MGKEKWQNICKMIDLEKYEQYLWQVYAKSEKLQLHFGFLLSAIETISKAALRDNIENENLSELILLDFARKSSKAIKESAPDSDKPYTDELYEEVRKIDTKGAMAYISYDEELKLYHLLAFKGVTDYHEQRFVRNKLHTADFILSNCKEEIKQYCKLLQS
jgi:hypothetical protein